ncbi:hypothetical protein HGH93_02875 [Chitinophaga polysaccharea]|uniref:hypothetical protein n=1 Tax=Chitinophaga TaxID=79328 RepID=UPI0014555676|nr:MULTISPECIES: hypothetical protein [Chitinophaga]NLR57027.1 hypothetical protein [Chitinophaga polysaccharea]NLU91848.1 hypothetical protein [Chitinophaga sp. Ak27]
MLRYLNKILFSSVMVKVLTSVSVLLFAIALLRPFEGYGHDKAISEKAPFTRYLLPVADSVPLTNHPADKPAEKPVDPSSLPVIKEVPKTRRMVKPMALPSPLPVQPIKIIKPKIVIKKLI